MKTVDIEVGQEYAARARATYAKWLRTRVRVVEVKAPRDIYRGDWSRRKTTKYDGIRVIVLDPVTGKPAWEERNEDGSITITAVYVQEPWSEYASRKKEQEAFKNRTKKKREEDCQKLEKVIENLSSLGVEARTLKGEFRATLEFNAEEAEKLASLLAKLPESSFKDIAE